VGARLGGIPHGDDARRDIRLTRSRRRACAGRDPLGIVARTTGLDTPRRRGVAAGHRGGGRLRPVQPHPPTTFPRRPGEGADEMLTRREQILRAYAGVEDVTASDHTMPDPLAGPDQAQVLYEMAAIQLEH